MILVKGQVEDFAKFWSVFSTEGAEFRATKGSKGSQVFQGQDDPNEVWILFNWTKDGWNEFLADPKSAELMNRAGLKGPPETHFLETAGEADA